MRAFIDSNILVYLFDHGEPVKQQRAANLFARHQDDIELVLSTQVLQEFFVVVTRKLEKPLSINTAEQAVQNLSVLSVLTVDVDLIRAAIVLVRSNSFSFWDALIVRAAQRTGAEILFTEDMQDGREIEGLKIVNPLLEDFAAH